MKKLRHESAVLDCLLRAHCAETLASRRVVYVVIENIRVSH